VVQTCVHSGMWVRNWTLGRHRGLLCWHWQQC